MNSRTDPLAFGKSDLLEDSPQCKPNTRNGRSVLEERETNASKTFLTINSLERSILDQESLSDLVENISSYLDSRDSESELFYAEFLSILEKYYEYAKDKFPSSDYTLSLSSFLAEWSQKRTAESVSSSSIYSLNTSDHVNLMEICENCKDLKAQVDSLEMKNLADLDESNNILCQKDHEIQKLKELLEKYSSVTDIEKFYIGYVNKIRRDIENLLDCELPIVKSGQREMLGELFNGIRKALGETAKKLRKKYNFQESSCQFECSINDVIDTLQRLSAFYQETTADSKKNTTCLKLGGKLIHLFVSKRNTDIWNKYEGAPEIRNMIDLSKQFDGTDILKTELIEGISTKLVEDLRESELTIENLYDGFQGSSGLFLNTQNLESKGLVEDLQQNLKEKEILIKKLRSQLNRSELKRKDLSESLNQREEEAKRIQRNIMKCTDILGNHCSNKDTADSLSKSIQQIRNDANSSDCSIKDRPKTNVESLEKRLKSLTVLEIADQTEKLTMNMKKSLNAIEKSWILREERLQEQRRSRLSKGNNPMCIPENQISFKSISKIYNDKLSKMPLQRNSRSCYETNLKARENAVRALEDKLILQEQNLNHEKMRINQLVRDLVVERENQLAEKANQTINRQEVHTHSDELYQSVYSVLGILNKLL